MSLLQTQKVFITIINYQKVLHLPIQAFTTNTKGPYHYTLQQIVQYHQ